MMDDDDDDARRQMFEEAGRLDDSVAPQIEAVVA
jgi:hypothetical protein